MDENRRASEDRSKSLTSFGVLRSSKPARVGIGSSAPALNRVHDEAAANGSLNGTTPKSDSRIVHEETFGNCRCCRNSIAHRLERGDACIGGARLYRASGSAARRMVYAREASRLRRRMQKWLCTSSIGA